MSGVSGDFARLHVVLERVSADRIASVKRALIRNLAEEARTQIALGFEKGRAPDGTPWRPLARKRNRDARGTKGTPLNDTGRLKNAWTMTIGADGFTWTNNVVYAAAHQFGASISHRARTNAHAKSGRFISRTAAGKRKSKVRVSFARGSVQTLPARPMVPIGELTPPWQSAFQRVASRTLLGFGMGG